MYCEQCGAKILPGSRFCEECGAPVDYIEEKTEAAPAVQDGSVFDGRDWAGKWKSFANTKASGYFGLIVTDTSRCADSGPFMEALYDYIYWSANKRGVHYQILDLKTQKVCSPVDNEYDIVGCLKSIASVVRPSFQLIIGDWSVVPSFIFDNYCNDGDESVPSDLPYCTLRTVNLFEGIGSFSLNGFIPTGRIPASPDDGFAIASEYFANVMNSYEGRFSGPVLGVSALVWADESNAIYSRLSEGKVLNSPPVSKEMPVVDLARTEASGILYFNLHGSNQTQYWYGQEDWSYPEAVSPESFKGLAEGYVIGVEACYGAAYDGRSDSESIVKTVLKSGCSCFLGSSVIAYGTSEEPGSCADIIVGTFLLGIRNGKSVSDSYLDGISALLGPDIDDAEVKTLQEFALYGDPSLGTSGSYGSERLNSLLSVSIPDIRKSTTRVLGEVNDKLAKAMSKQISKYVYGKYKLFKHVAPELMGGDGRYQSVFKKKESGLSHVLKVYYDSNGKVLKELISK